MEVAGDFCHGVIKQGATLDDSIDFKLSFAPHVRVEENEHEENQYIELINELLEHGESKENRTGTDTIGKFGHQMRFSLSEGFPLLTTKKVFWKGVVEELLWFLRGETDSTKLAEKGVHIWDANGSREFLDSRGLGERAIGDLGPVYGFQWRHFGAKYGKATDDYTGQGYDQLKECIRLLKEEPFSRRIIISAWNPEDLKEMALPPCHMFVQFYVTSRGELNTLMYQRSCDVGLGVPFNIASYSLLTCILAHHCGLKRGEFVYSMGDVHIYKNHLEALRGQLERTPYPFPSLKILASQEKEVDQYEWEDFLLENYKHHPTIKMDMVV